MYEGFGIPLLEAMHFGCPYVVSNLPVFRELTANRAQYFEPTHPEDIAAGMSRVLESRELQRELIELGRQRLKIYDYSRLAQRYAAILSTLTM
jgi:glycosyltransferase involved in cell wall biosynthesis